MGPFSCLFVNPSILLSVYWHIHPSFFPFIFSFINPYILLSIHWLTSCVHPSVILSVYSVHPIIHSFTHSPFSLSIPPISTSIQLFVHRITSLSFLLPVHPFGAFVFYILSSLVLSIQSPIHLSIIPLSSRPSMCQVCGFYQTPC